MSNEVVGTSDLSENKSIHIDRKKASLAVIGFSVLGLGLLLSRDVHANPSIDIDLSPTPTGTPTTVDLKTAPTITSAPDKMATSAVTPTPPHTSTATETFTASPTANPKDRTATPTIRISPTATPKPIEYTVFLPEIKRITGEPVVTQNEDKMRQFPETIYITPALRDIIMKYLYPQLVKPENSAEIIDKSKNGQYLVYSGEIYNYYFVVPSKSIYEVILDKDMLASAGPTATPTPPGNPYPPPFDKQNNDRNYSSIPPKSGALPYANDPAPTKGK